MLGIQLNMSDKFYVVADTGSSKFLFNADFLLCSGVGSLSDASSGWYGAFPQPGSGLLFTADIKSSCNRDCKSFGICNIESPTGNRIEDQTT